MINYACNELSRAPIIWKKLLAAFLFMIGLVLPANTFGDTVWNAPAPRLCTQE